MNKTMTNHQRMSKRLEVIEKALLTLSQTVDVLVRLVTTSACKDCNGAGHYKSKVTDKEEVCNTCKGKRRV